MPPQNEEPREFNLEESFETLLKRQEEMEKRFNVYLQTAKLKKVQSSKPKHSVKDRNKWLAFQFVEDRAVYKVRQSKLENNVEAGQCV